MQQFPRVGAFAKIGATLVLIALIGQTESGEPIAEVHELDEKGQTEGARFVDPAELTQPTYAEVAPIVQARNGEPYSVLHAHRSGYALGPEHEDAYNVAVAAERREQAAPASTNQ